MTNNDEFARPFNFNLEEMTKAVESKGIEVPEWALMDVESFIKWLEMDVESLIKWLEGNG